MLNFNNSSQNENQISPFQTINQKNFCRRAVYSHWEGKSLPICYASRPLAPWSSMPDPWLCFFPNPSGAQHCFCCVQYNYSTIIYCYHLQTTLRQNQLHTTDSTRITSSVQRNSTTSLNNFNTVLKTLSTLLITLCTRTYINKFTHSKLLSKTYM